MFEKAITQKVFQYFENIEQGILEIVTPDGAMHIFGGKKTGEKAKVILHDWSVLGHVVRKGDIGLAECYRNGMWSTDNLVGLIILVMNNRDTLDDLGFGSRLFSLQQKLSYYLRINTLRGSKKNIHAHYDLGNKFYSLWLDPSMTYSSALFNEDTENLEKAQKNKYQRIIDCIGEKPGDILEVGCGWAGFAEHALEQGVSSIKGITLSKEQHDYAQERLSKSANIVLEDYRYQKGKYDHIVSIEMFEAVGERYWQTYFQKISSLLKSKGKAVIQTITINDKDFDRYRKNADFIRSYIFPGGMLPGASRFSLEAEKSSLKTQNEYFFGQDYARTLEHWLQNFEEKNDQVKRLGFDDGFIRLWRFYLGACIAGFKTGHTNVMQVELVHD